MVAGYATGTLYEHNQKTLCEMEEGYDGMLVILQKFLPTRNTATPMLTAFPCAPPK